MFLTLKWLFVCLSDKLLEISLLNIHPSVFAFNRLKIHFLRMQLTSSVPAYSYHMVHVNVYGLFYFYVILYTMHTMYISAICILLVNRNSLKTGRSGRSRDRPVIKIFHVNKFRSEKAVENVPPWHMVLALID